MKNYTKLANQWVSFCFKSMDIHFDWNGDCKINIKDYPDVFMRMKKLNQKEFDKMVNTLDCMED